MRNQLEYAGLTLFHGLCRILPARRASDLSGFLVRTVGCKIGANKKALNHIKNALHCNDHEARIIVADMWDNLGRVLGEYPHLKILAEKYVRIIGIEHLEALRDDNKPGILFGAHLANWEILPYALLHHVGLAMHPVYRAPNNPYVDRKLHTYRTAGNKLVPYAKSRQGMIGMVKALKSGEHLGMLIDQKYNEGITADFFDMPAKTGTAFIELAQKYDCPLIPLRCIREKSGFCIEALPPIPTLNRSVEDILDEAHHLLEKWIREYPSQWLWLHRRWMRESKNINE